jgi:hypothetical protein
VASPRDERAEEVPQQLPNVLPPDISAGTGHLRLIVQELKDDIKEIKDNRHSDFIFHVNILGGGFLLLAGMIIASYLLLDSRMSKSDDRVNTLTNTSVRIETKLEDLLQRIPPVPTPPPARR